MELTNQEKIEKLQEAQEKLFDVIEAIEEVFPDDANIKAYLTDHLRIYASDEHGFLTSNPNLDELMSTLMEERGDPPRKIRKKKIKVKKKKK